MVRIPVKREKKEEKPAVEAISEEKVENEPQIEQKPKSELEEIKNRYLYLKADFENYKRNAEKERERLVSLGEEKVISDLFPIFRYMEKAIETATKASVDKAILDGLLLVQREIQKIFDKYNIKRIKTIGEKFNPEFHEAISAVEKEDTESGTIVDEYEPGFEREGRLIQPAKVIVAK